MSPLVGVTMPEAITTTTTQDRALRLTLNSDGRRHPILNAATAFTFVAGVAAFPLGLIVRDHLAATVVGMVAFAVGMVAQLISATREERIFIVAGLVAGFIGMGLGIAHGGFG
jgi:hypothetical protein